VTGPRSVLVPLGLRVFGAREVPAAGTGDRDRARAAV